MSARTSGTDMGTEMTKCLAAVGLSLAMAGCGGDDGGSGTITGPSGWTQGSYLPSSTFKNQCANPRQGTNSSGQPFPDTQGTFLTENNWLRSWTDELYLWYDEVVDRNPGNFANTRNYFSLLKTTQTTASGAAKDKFHFTWSTAEWESFSQSGVTAGYGAMFNIISDRPPRKVVVLFVEPNSPAAEQGLLRGDEVVTVDGIDFINGSNTNALNAGLFPQNANESHTLGIRNGGGTRNVTMVSAEVASKPVHTVEVIPTASGPVGYMLFNDHIATAEDGLIDAVETLQAASIQDLVLDVRYNGGGYLAIASQLAYMIAGSSRTAGQVFERMVWNNKHTTTNPVTGQPLAPMPFIDETIGFSRPEGAALPTLNLSRVYVLTGPGTCSASESIMNSLRGVDVEVIQIGTTTCGKPYGFYALDNCGTTYFSVQFKGVNAKNYGDYTDGFSPENTPAADRREPVPGCAVLDDLADTLGDPDEQMLSAALAHRMSGQCPAPPSASLGQNKLSGAMETVGVIARPPYREIRRMRDVDLTP